MIAGAVRTRHWAPLLSGHLAILRLPVSGLAFAGTFLGAHLAGRPLQPLAVVAALALSNALLCSASMLFNDWRDIEIDRINKPHRPLPSGRVRPTTALGAGAALFATGVLLATAVAPATGWMAAGVTVLSLLYTFRFKRVPLAGNAIVALLGAYPLWCWIALGARPSPTYLVLLLGCGVFFLGEEILKTAEDVAGDGACGVPTIAGVLGVRTSHLLGAGLVLAGLASAWAPVVAGRFTFGYLAALGASLAVAGLLVAWALRGDPDDRLSSRMLLHVRLIKVVMAVALGFGMGSGSPPLGG